MNNIDKEANFTILLPGKCNANCAFCTWNKEKSRACTGYKKILKNTIENLPSNFKYLSISGGEPTLSPFFDYLMSIIPVGRFERVVLTTNGANLSHKIAHMGGVVDHVNISRHSINDEKNYEIFKADYLSIPSAIVLHSINERLNKGGIDVTYNCVVSHDQEVNVKEFVQFVKDTGANYMCFRKNSHTGNLQTSKAEKDYKEYKTVYSDECNICRTSAKIIGGVWVYFKSSLTETDNRGPYIYDAILHPNGKLTSDWGGDKEIIFN